MTEFEILSVATGIIASTLSTLALVVALWNAKSASRQAMASEDQTTLARIHELEVLYSARLDDLTNKYDTVRIESNLHKLHVQRCEEELAKITEQILQRRASHGFPTEG